MKVPEEHKFEWSFCGHKSYTSISITVPKIKLIFIKNLIIYNDKRLLPCNYNKKRR